MLYGITHARTLHPQPQSPNRVSHPLCDIWRCYLYLRMAQFHRGLKTVARLQHDPPNSSFRKIPHSYLRLKTSTRLRHCVAEEVQLLPTCVNHIRPPEVTLCHHYHSPNFLQSLNKKIHCPIGGGQGHVQGLTLNLWRQPPASDRVPRCIWKECQHQVRQTQ